MQMLAEHVKLSRIKFSSNKTESITNIFTITLKTKSVSGNFILRKKTQSDSFLAFFFFTCTPSFLVRDFHSMVSCLSVEAGCERDALDGEESGLKVWKEVN